MRWRLAASATCAEPEARPGPALLSNWDLNQQEIGELPDVLRSKPILVYAEATTRCNLKCFMCRLSFPETTRRTRQHMPLATFAKLEPLLGPDSRLSLFGLGEPLLNPDFIEMLRIAKERGTFVGLNSNAMLLTDRVARAMVELEQDLLVISFSGGTKPTYERIITGANYERVLANLRRLNEFRAERVKPGVRLEQVKPVLQLQFTLMMDNLREVPAAVRLAMELRCASLVAMPLTVFDPSLEEQSVLSPDMKGLIEGVTEEARAVASTADYPFELQMPFDLDRAISQRARRRPERLALSPQSPVLDPAPSVLSPRSSVLCYEPWQTFYVRDDGTVNTCCYSNRTLGDLKEQTALEVWNGEPYRRFRSRMRSADKPAECRVCHKLLGDDLYDQRVEEEGFYDEL